MKNSIRTFLDVLLRTYILTVTFNLIFHILIKHNLLFYKWCVLKLAFKIKCFASLIFHNFNLYFWNIKLKIYLFYYICEVKFSSSFQHNGMTYITDGLVTSSFFRDGHHHVVRHLDLIEIVNSNVLRQDGPNIAIEINAMLMTVVGNDIIYNPDI